MRERFMENMMMVYIYIYVVVVCIIYRSIVYYRIELVDREPQVFFIQRVVS